MFEKHDLLPSSFECRKADLRAVRRADAACCTPLDLATPAQTRYDAAAHATSKYNDAKDVMGSCGSAHDAEALVAGRVHDVASRLRTNAPEALRSGQRER